MFGIFKSIKKSSQLVKISNVFREDYSFDFQSMMKSSNKREEATDDLIDLAFSDENNAVIIKKYKIKFTSIVPANDTPPPETIEKIIKK
mgnify:CR=1 FL=1